MTISPVAALGFPCRSPAEVQEAVRHFAESAVASRGTGADFLRSSKD